MKYSRSRLNSVGKVLSQKEENLFAYAEAIILVDDWRKTHAVPLEALAKQISELLIKADIPVAFASQRLKRMTSIIGKLKRNPQMGLGGVQDIGGARFVFDDIPTLMKAKELIASFSNDSFTLAKEPYDYVSSPKSSGYRSIHFVYKYHSEDKNFDGLSVELQIRTRLQHDWATAVETAELITKSSLKASLGDDNWLEFFKLTSAIFARREGSPVGEQFVPFNEHAFCTEYNTLEKKYHFIDKLNGLVGAVKFAQDQSFKKGYALLLIDFDKRIVNVNTYSLNELDAANNMYSQVESSINQDSGAVVLVSAASMTALKDAYPSYFLNAGEFIQALGDFMNNCKMKGYIK